MSQYLESMRGRIPVSDQAEEVVESAAMPEKEYCAFCNAQLSAPEVFETEMELLDW
jgi:hypothetical protein